MARYGREDSHKETQSRRSSKGVMAGSRVHGDGASVPDNGSIVVNEEKSSASHGMRRFAVVDGGLSSGHAREPMGTEAFPRQQPQSFVHLDESLLIRLKTPDNGDERILVCCGSKEIGRSGLRLMLPTSLNLRQGSSLDMELFLTTEQQPVRVEGEVRSVRPVRGQDSVFYGIEVKFVQTDSSFERKISDFIQTSQMRKCRAPAA